MTLEELQAAARDGHECGPDCVAASDEDCVCSSAPDMCPICERFYYDHPRAM